MKVSDLVKVVHGPRSGTIGLIVSFVSERYPKATLACLHTGKHFNVDRLEVIS